MPKQPKTFVVQKCEGTVNYKTSFIKFLKGYLHLDDQASSVWLKTMDSETVVNLIEADLVFNMRRVSGEFDITQSSVVHHSIQSFRIIL